MIEVHLAQIPQPLNVLKRWLGEGWKGYYEMRGRELIGLFEEEYKNISSSPKDHTMTFWDRRKQYGDELDRAALDDPEQKDLRFKFHTQGNILLNQLIELAFDLDFDD
jgi:hypothetical protein